MHGANDIGSSEAEHLVAAFKRGATKVVRSKIEVLYKCAKGAVKYNDAFVHGLKISLSFHVPYKLSAQDQVLVTLSH